jgi:hypothetical protein
MGVARSDSGAKDSKAKRKALVLLIMRAVALASLVIAVGLYACTERPAPVVQRPRAVPAPPPVAPTPPPQVTGSWEDWPYSPGDWAYRQDSRGSVALFGPAGAEAQFLVRCDLNARKVFASRAGAFPAGETGRMTIRATTGLQTYAVANTGSTKPYIAAELQPMDRHLDAMAFSRGRFVVSVRGATDLVVPSWPELARVVEDCRG